MKPWSVILCLLFTTPRARWGQWLEKILFEFCFSLSCVALCFHYCFVFVCLRTSKIQVWGCDLHLFIAQIVFLITRVKLIQRHFVTINMRFHDFRLLRWLEVIRHKEVHFDYFWAHFREEDKKSTVASRHWRLHKFTFGIRCHWRPWRIEERKENEEIAFPAIFPANHHHKRRQHRRTTTGVPPQGRRFPRPAAHMCMAGHTCIADPTCPLTHLHLHLPFLSILPITHSPLPSHPTRRP